MEDCIQRASTMSGKKHLFQKRRATWKITELRDKDKREGR